MKPERMARIEAFYGAVNLLSQANNMIGDLLGEQATDNLAVKDAERRAAAAEDFLEEMRKGAAALDAQHKAIADDLKAKLDAAESALQKCEEARKSHVCNNSAVLNVTQSPENRSELVKAQEHLAQHKATIESQGRKIDELQRELKRERAEHRKTLDAKEQLIAASKETLAVRTGQPGHPPANADLEPDVLQLLERLAVADKTVAILERELQDVRGQAPLPEPMG